MTKQKCDNTRGMIMKMRDFFFLEKNCPINYKLKQTTTHNNGDKIIKTNKTMNFTQNNLFFVCKEKSLDNFLLFIAMHARSGMLKFMQLQMIINGQQNGCQA